MKLQHILAFICLGSSLGMFAFLGIFSTGILDGKFPGRTRAYVITSGSMEPVIPVGSVVISQEFKNYKVGDVITFNNSGVKDKFVTHRITKLENDGFITKGDSNEEEDNGIIKQEQIVGKSVVTIPYVGRIVNFVKTPVGFVAMVVVPATIIVYEELKSIFSEFKKAFVVLRRKTNTIKIEKELREPNGQPKKVKAYWRAGIVFPIIGLAFVVTALSTAYFSDNENSPENVLGVGMSTTHTSSPSPTRSLQGSVVINEINWAASNGNGLDEWVELKNMTNSPINIGGWLIENLGTGNGVNKNLVIPSGMTIPANSFFLISNRDHDNSKINITPDLVDTNVSLDNGGELLILKNESSVVIDTANGITSWHAGSNSTPKKTMERISPPGDGVVLSNWQTAITHTNMDGNGSSDEFGTPKSENGI